MLETFTLTIIRDGFRDITVNINTRRDVIEALRTYPPMRARGSVAALNGEVIATGVHGTHCARWCRTWG